MSLFKFNPFTYPFFTQQVRTVTKLTRVYFADNSENAKKSSLAQRPTCIGLPKNSKKAGCGDIITVAHKGKVYKALVVSNTKPSKTLPKYDRWYMVLLNEKLEPIGSRITIPLPTQLRLQKDKHSKVISIGNKFI